MKKVYFVLSGDRIKIGFSANIPKRLSSLRSSSAHPMQLLGAIDGGRELEAAIHEKLSAKRKQREWFEDCEEVRALLQDLMERGHEAVSEFYRPPKPLTKMPRLSRDDQVSLGIGVENHPLVLATTRLAKIAHHPVMCRVRLAAEMEKVGDLPTGSLMLGELKRWPNGRERHKNAIDVIIQADALLRKLSDEATLRFFRGEGGANLDVAGAACMAVAADAENKIFDLLGRCRRSELDANYDSAPELT